MKTWKQPFLWITLVLLGLVAALPLLLGSVSLREDLFLIFEVIIFASSVNIITGYTGYVSFGHIVFLGLGGYIAFFLILNLGTNFVIAALVAGIGASIFALLLGWPILRLRGAYFALATIGINEAVSAFMNNFDPFGGSNGMTFNLSVYDA